MPASAMGAGALDQRVILELPARAIDAYGAEVVAYQTLQAAWARVEPLTGTELQVARQNNARVTHRVTLRANVARLIDSRARIRMGTRILCPVSVLELDSAATWAELLCIEET